MVAGGSGPGRLASGLFLSLELKKLLSFQLYYASSLLTGSSTCATIGNCQRRAYNGSSEKSVNPPLARLCTKI